MAQPDQAPPDPVVHVGAQPTRPGPRGAPGRSVRPRCAWGPRPGGVLVGLLRSGRGAPPERRWAGSSAVQDQHDSRPHVNPRTVPWPVGRPRTPKGRARVVVDAPGRGVPGHGRGAVRARPRHPVPAPGRHHPVGPVHRCPGQHGHAGPVRRLSRRRRRWPGPTPSRWRRSSAPRDSSGPRPAASSAWPRRSRSGSAVWSRPSSPTWSPCPGWGARRATWCAASPSASRASPSTPMCCRLSRRLGLDRARAIRSRSSTTSTPCSRAAERGAFSLRLILHGRATCHGPAAGLRPLRLGRHLPVRRASMAG